MADKFLPIDVIEAAVSAMGKVFYYKSALKLLLRRAGVSEAWYKRYESETKFAIARHVFGDLELRGETGREVAVRIVQELCAIRKPPDDKVDQDVAIAALQQLRTLSRQARIESAREEMERESRVSKERDRLRNITAREEAIGFCYASYCKLVTSSDRQRRGYELETFLKELFLAHDINYTPPFRGVGEQIDGAFRYGAFDYLVEAKWTREEAGLADLDTFKAKVDRKLASTRGIFLSISSFDDEMVSHFERNSNRSVILMSGEDLVLILEGRVSLTDALDLKIALAAQKGRLFVQLREHI